MIDSAATLKSRNVGFGDIIDIINDTGANIKDAINNTIHNILPNIFKIEQVFTIFLQ